MKFYFINGILATQEDVERLQEDAKNKKSNPIIAITDNETVCRVITY